MRFRPTSSTPVLALMQSRSGGKKAVAKQLMLMLPFFLLVFFVHSPYQYHAPGADNYGCRPTTCVHRCRRRWRHRLLNANEDRRDRRRPTLIIDARRMHKRRRSYFRIDWRRENRYIDILIPFTSSRFICLLVLLLTDSLSSFLDARAVRLPCRA